MVTIKEFPRLLALMRMVPALKSARVMTVDDYLSMILEPARIALEKLSLPEIIRAGTRKSTRTQAPIGFAYQNAIAGRWKRTTEP